MRPRWLLPVGGGGGGSLNTTGSALWPRTSLRKGFECFWLPAGSPVSLSDLLCAHSPGFAKKTFISYSVTFKENFRQGLVVDIDLQNQTVLLEDGEVSTVGADLDLC